jgi:hypothetical protein
VIEWRREFITLLSGAATAWLLAARAQQPATPVIGFFHIASLETRRQEVASFYQGLKDIGYVEGQNVAIEDVAGPRLTGAGSRPRRNTARSMSSRRCLSRLC